jgi:hypothetical protein
MLLVKHLSEVLQSRNVRHLPERDPNGHFKIPHL